MLANSTLQPACLLALPAPPSRDAQGPAGPLVPTRAPPLPPSLPASPAQGDGIKSIIIPGIVGIVLGLGVGMLIFYT